MPEFFLEFWVGEEIANQNGIVATQAVSVLDKLPRRNGFDPAVKCKGL